MLNDSEMWLLQDILGRETTTTTTKYRPLL